MIYKSPFFRAALCILSTVFCCLLGCGPGNSGIKRAALEDYLWDKSYDISDTDIVIIIDGESSENCRFGLYMGLIYAEVNRKSTLVLVGEESEIRTEQRNYLKMIEKESALNDIDVVIDETEIWSYYKELAGFKKGDIILAGVSGGKVFKGKIMNNETYIKGTKFPDDVLKGL
jgi:hypothetical protein